MQSTGTCFQTSFFYPSGAVHSRDMQAEFPSTKAASALPRVPGSQDLPGNCLSLPLIQPTATCEHVLVSIPVHNLLQVCAFLFIESVTYIRFSGNLTALYQLQYIVN
jgi:hypothetical protein